MGLGGGGTKFTIKKPTAKLNHCLTSNETGLGLNNDRAALTSYTIDNGSRSLAAGRIQINEWNNTAAFHFTIRVRVYAPI